MKPLNWIQWITLATVIALATTIPLIFFRLDNVSRHQTDALRTIICFTESRVRVSTTLTTKQQRQAIQFYDQALAAIHSRACDPAPKESK